MHIGAFTMIHMDPGFAHLCLDLFDCQMIATNPFSDVIYHLQRDKISEYFFSFQLVKDIFSFPFVALCFVNDLE